MTAGAKKILEQAMSLSDEERMDLVTALRDSFEPAAVELSPEWQAEIANRIAQVERGEVEPIAWDAVKAQIEQALGRR